MTISPAFGIDPLREASGPDRTPRPTPAVRLTISPDTARESARRSTGALRTGDRRKSCPVRSWRCGGGGVAIQHRLMHAETLAYLLHQLPPRAKGPGPLPRPSPDSPRRWIEVAAGRARLGLRALGSPFRLGQRVRRARRRGPGLRHRLAQRDERRLPALRPGGRLQRSLPLVPRSLGLAPSGLRSTIRGTGSGTTGRWFYRAMFGEVPLGGVLAGLREPRRGVGLRAVAGRRSAHGGAVSPRGLRRAGGPERSFPWGEAPPTRRARRSSASAAGIPDPVGAHPAGDTPAGSPISWATAGSGRRARFEPFPGFEPLPVLSRDTPQISSTESTTC